MSLPESSAKLARVPTGFNVVPPPGWDIIPLQNGTDEAIRKIVNKSVLQLPPGFPKDDIPKARLRLIKELKETVRQARKSNGLSLYLPIERIHGMIIPASFVASEPLHAQVGDVDSRDLLINIAQNADISSARELDEIAAVRTLQKLPPAPDKGVEVPSWRVQYVVPIPNSTPARLMTFTFSTLIVPDMDIKFAETLVELFDAVMTTFRWSYA
ncbi:hypothetical protein [Streptomyces sp. NPDC006012]|uniref:hypothetical protein n=1 Tax=Streptomyces sp. NPDC006012 TaxID=3364739 RepID=UPI0036A0D8E2